MSTPGPSSSTLALQLFRTLDPSETGFINSADLTDFIEDATKLAEVLDALDPDGTGKISQDKFVESFASFMEEDAEDEELAGEDTFTESPAATPSPGLPATLAATTAASSPVQARTHHKSVSFDVSSDLVAPPPKKQPTGMMIPPAGAKKAALLAAGGGGGGGGSSAMKTMRPPTKKILPKKGYASLKYSLILDELRRSPAVGGLGVSILSPSTGGSDFGSTPSPTLSTSSASSATHVRTPTLTLGNSGLHVPPTHARAPSVGGSPLMPPAALGRHTRQASSIDYSFTYSKSHHSLLDRARKILAWCEDAAEGPTVDAEGEPVPPATITFPEIETSIHYLARSFHPQEQADLLALFQLHQIAVLPVQVFRDVIRACLEKEEHQKATLLAEQKAASAAQKPISTSMAPGTSITMSSVSTSSSAQAAAQAAAREFNPDAFTTNFLEQLQRRIEVLDVRGLQGHAAAGANGHANLLSGPSTPSSVGSPVSLSTSGETLLLKVRTDLRQSESERLHLKQRYEFNLVFTKQLEAENWRLKDELDQMTVGRARATEAEEEHRLALEAHRVLCANLEATLAREHASQSQQREEYENLRVMLELERKTRTKLAHDVEKLQASLRDAASIRSGTNKAYFREGLEEMRKQLGNLRYQRALQLEVATMDVVRTEKQEVVARLREALTTLEEQQRILNELQASRMGREAAWKPMQGIGSEMRGGAGTTQGAGDGASASAVRDSLSDDLGEAFQEEEATLADDVAIRSSLQQALEAQQDAEERATRRERELSQVEGELELIKQELTATQTREQREVHARHSMQLQLDGAQEAYATLQTQLTESSGELARIQQEHAAQVSTLEEQHHAAMAGLRKAHEDALSSLQAQHASAVESVQSSERAQAAERLEGQLHFLRTEHARAQAEWVDAHQGQMSQLQKRVDDLQSAAVKAREALSGQEASLAANVSALEQTVAEVTGQNQSLQQQLRVAKAEISDLTLRLSDSASALVSAQQDHATQVSGLEALIQTWKTEAERGRTQLDAWKKTAKEEAESRKSDLDQLEARIRALEKEKADLEDQWRTHVCVGGGANVISSVSTGTVATAASLSPTVPSSTAPSSSSSVASSPVVVPARLGSPMFVLGNADAPKSLTVATTTTTTTKLLPYSASQLLELHAYGTYITQAVGGDADLRHLFPLDLLPLDTVPSPSPDPSSGASSPLLSHHGYGLDLLRKLKDGLLLAKLINHVAPRTIDERVLNRRVDSAQSLGWQAIVENLNVCITSAKSLGLTMRVPHDQLAEIDSHTGSVRTTDGRRVSIGEEADLAASSPASTPSSSGHAAPDVSPQPENYVGIELGPSQLLLMSADSTLESVDILLDFLFQLIKSRLVNALFGPEKKKLERVPLAMPKLVDAEQRRLMLLRTASIQPSADPTAMAAMAAGAPAGKKGKLATLSKYATLSKALPSNLTSVEHKRFVSHFTTCVLNDFDAPGELACMAPDQLLLRWVNYQIMAYASTPAGKEKQLHLVAHLSDLDVQTYAVVVAQIDRWRIDQGLLLLPDADDPSSGVSPTPACFDTDCTSATALLDYLARTLAVKHFHTADAIVTHHTRLNLLLTAVLFQKWPLIREAEPNHQAHHPQPAHATPGQQSPAPSASGLTVGAGATSGPLARATTKHAPKMSLSFETGTVAGHLGNLGASSASASLPSLDGLTEEERESTLLKSWLNSSGIPHISINDLFTDVRSGLVLLRFLDYLSGGCVDWKVVELQPSNKFKCVSNLNLFLQVSRAHLHLAFVNVSGPDLYSDANSKFVLAVLWQLLRFHTIAKLNELRSRMASTDVAGTAGAHKEITDASILAWANQTVGARVHALTQSHAAPLILSFHDPNLRNSLFLLNLLDNLKPGCVDWTQVEVAPIATGGPGVVPTLADPSLLLRNASLTISIARKLGAELFALPSDIAQSKQKVIVLLIASLMAIESAEHE